MRGREGQGPPIFFMENRQGFNGLSLDLFLKGAITSQLYHVKDQEAWASEGHLRFKLHYLSILANQ